MSQEIEIQEPALPCRTIRIDGVVELGRELDGILLADPEVSRRHLSFSCTGDSLTVSDLGSTNGTKVNGSLITGPTVLHLGDIVTAGATKITVLGTDTGTAGASAEQQKTLSLEPQPACQDPGEPAQLEPSADVESSEVAETAATVETAGSDARAKAAPTPATPGPPPAAPKRRPVIDELTSQQNDAATVFYRPSTAGEKYAAAVLQGAKQARKRLSGLGSEPWGVLPTICLVDPFPDPDDPTKVMTEGTIVDPQRNEIWMVVTSESPPEPLERPLALLFGGSLPAADDLSTLLEGYGLYVAESQDPDPELRQLELPMLMSATGQTAGAMALSFVRYLIERASKADLLKLFVTAQPGKLDAAAQQIYGAGFAVLEEAWRRKLAAGPPDVKTGQFLRLVMRYIRPHAAKELEMFVYMLFGLLFTVVFPFALRELLDRALPSGHFSQVLRILYYLSIAFVISMLASLRQAYLAAKVSGSVVRQLRREMFEKMQGLSQGWFSQRQQGDVLSRLFSDVGMLEQGLSQTLRNGLFQLLSLIVSTVVLFTLNPILALVVVAGAPVIALVYKLMAKGAQKRSIAVQEETGSVLAVAAENYGAQSVVKAFGLQAREIGRFRQVSDRLFDRQVKLQLFGGLFGLSVNMIVTGLRVFILGLGAWLILLHPVNTHLTVGGLVAFMGLMGEVLSPVTVLTGIGQQIQSATGALVRINEVLDAEPEVDEPIGATELLPLSSSIELQNVGFSYTPEQRTLEDINVKISAGDKVAFVGPTGAGKSSILQLLMRFYDPDEGKILFDGKDVRDSTVASLRGQLGVVFQETFLFNATIAENIGLGKPGATQAEIETAAHAAELHDFIMTQPRGYDTLVGERGGRLSGGQRQRLSIARALLRDPKVLLLDEATSALDPKTERLISDTLDKVGVGRTTIAVTHRLTSIVRYDRIFVIAAGHLVEKGTHDELVALGGLYSQLWAEQIGGHVTAEAPFDLAGALSSIPLFAALDAEGLADIAQRLQAIDLQPGATIAEGGGRLAIVRHGRAEVLTPNLAGDPVPTAVLGPGDAFGVSALLGEESATALRAAEQTSILVLNDESIRALAAIHPSIAAVLSGPLAGVVQTESQTPRPVGGKRLSRMTLGPGLRSSLSIAGLADETHSSSAVPPSGQEVRRMTGALPVIGR